MGGLLENPPPPPALPPPPPAPPEMGDQCQAPMMACMMGEPTCNSLIMSTDDPNLDISQFTAACHANAECATFITCMCAAEPTCGGTPPCPCGGWPPPALPPPSPPSPPGLPGDPDCSAEGRACLSDAACSATLPADGSDSLCGFCLAYTDQTICMADLLCSALMQCIGGGGVAPTPAVIPVPTPPLEQR